MSVQIHRMQGDSRDLYLALGPFWGRTDIERELGGPLRNSPDKLWFVAVESSRAVGFVGLHREARGAILTHLYVVPERRGQGICDALLGAWLEVAGDDPAHVVANESSLPLLTARGFTEVRRRGRFHVLERRP